MDRIAPKALIVAALTAAAFPAAALAAHQIGSKSGSGDYAIALASGTANHPHHLYVKITTRPAQRATGSWTMVCSKGLSAGSKSGDISGSGTFRRTLRMPNRRPDDCTVSASGQLSSGGKILVSLLAD
jgi:hypothetical protein